LSANARFPRGLANRSGLVGKNLTFSGFGKAAAILERGAVAAADPGASLSLPFVNVSLQDDYWMKYAGLVLPKGGTYNALLLNPSPIEAAVRLTSGENWRLWGQALKDRLVTYYRDEVWLELEIFSEMLPNAGTFVDLDPTVKDPNGLPVARITAGRHPAATETNKAMVRRAMAILSAISPAPKTVKAVAWDAESFHLQQGTCRAGNDRERAVVDRHCRCHDVDNLYIVDGSFMPTCGGVPSTLTIIANGLRVGAHLRDRFLRRELG
jgi:choline dehydrogenase-like flavoprotein